MLLGIVGAVIYNNTVSAKKSADSEFERINDKDRRPTTGTLSMIGGRQPSNKSTSKSMTDEKERDHGSSYEPSRARCGGLPI